MCIRIGFNVIYDMQLCAVRWWASPLLMDLSPHTRVYVRGGRSVSNRSGFWPVQSGTWLQIPIKRSLDLSWLMCWLSYVGYQYDTVARQPSAWICHLPESLKRFLRSLWGPVCHHLYTSDKPFSELRNIFVVMAYDTCTHKWIYQMWHQAGKKTLSVKAKIWPTWWDVT